MNLKNNPNEVLKVTNLKKYFTSGAGVVRAVDEVSFSLKEGEILGLIGESGSGKTTVGRSLIRLYDDYSGLVTLNGKVISGKKINRNTNKFMRKNMQMIFQDPHTSLNPQHNVFSILKEPLIVNGILKEKYADFFKDWEIVKSTFKYTFLKEITLAENSILKMRLKTTNTLLEKYANFEKLDFSKFQTYEDAFNALLVFYEDVQALGNQVINRYYDVSEKLDSLYRRHQHEYRTSDLEDDEKQLKDARRSLKVAKILQKITLEKYNASRELKELKIEHKKLLHTKRSNEQRAKNVFKNYIIEYKKDYKYYKFGRLKAIEPAIYNYNYKKQLINQLAIQKLKSVYGKISFLPAQEIENLIELVNAYNSGLLKTISSNDKIFDRKNIENQIKTKFQIDFSKYTKLSDKRLENANKKIAEHQSKITQLSEKIKQMSGNSAERYPLAEAENNLAKAQEIYDKITATFKEKFDKELAIVLNNQAVILEDLKKANLEDKVLRDKAKAKQKEFFIWLKTNPLNTKDFDYKTLVKSYRSKVESRQDNVKSFVIEQKLLAKDFQNLKHTFGVIKRPWSKWLVKKIELRLMIFNALEEVGLLRQFAYRYPHEFSGGQRQRIVIARALISNPKVIIADEPIASLDISIQAQVVNLLKDLCRNNNIALIFIAHDLSMVEYIADKIHIMHLGKIVEEGETREIYNNPLHPYTINLFDSIPKLSNANIPFQASNFSLQYLMEQAYPNKPKMHFINQDHNLYANDEQFKKWTSKIKSN
ncbi:ATP-binding cassette domain-containing protein [Mycoplasmopsis agassizii]|uniref:ATP-binding cassette domain-containing protein n=1 Tax=Mycoplasmopsis agassizii TaxID=33922 RepID=UPI0035292EB3